MSARRNTVGATLLAVCLLGCGATASRNEGDTSARVVEQNNTLAATNKAFLDAVQSQDGERVSSFFPKQGTFTYTYLYHARSGDSLREERFAAAEARREIIEGSLSESLAPATHSIGVGTLYSETALRGTEEWVRVDATRFVPRSRGQSSAIYVEWRREGGRWVISAFGDEGFEDIPGS